MDSLCDTSCADITGHILEAFGLMMKLTPKTSKDTKYNMKWYSQIRQACERGITYLSSVQEPNGSWFGRRGCNYTYGTSHALCGLAYFTENDSRVSTMVQPALRWLKSEQNGDGGWGESLLSYQDPGRKQNPTASQTAWALMGLLAYLPHTDESVRRGVQYLVASQAPEEKIGSSWPETVYTGTGFPNHFYIGYDYYRHYFPMMALGRYLQAARCQK